MTVAAGLTLRVSVLDVWDTVEITVQPDETVAQVKREALRRAIGEKADPTAFLVKYRGALILDESQTLAALKIPDRAALIVLPARRQPVR